MTEPTTRPSQDRAPEQWTEADLRLATLRGEHDRIVAAHEAGQLHDLMNTPLPATTDTEGRLTTDGLARLTPAQQAAAVERGEAAHLHPALNPATIPGSPR